MKNLEDVFKLSGVPTYTFVEPTEYTRLLVALRSKGRGVVVEGPSGIGKTTCVKQVITRIDPENVIKVLSGRKSRDLDEINKILTTENFGTIIIDDFHRLNDSIKKSLSDLLKTLADEESETSKLVLVGINRTGKSLIEYSPDLRNRVDIIKFEANPLEKIEELIEKGEKSLNIKISIKEQIKNDALGSFHLAQMLAHNACLKSNILNEQNPDDDISTNISFESLREIILDDLALSFNGITINFCKGQRVKKGSRAPYLHVLNWLSKSDEMTINLESALIEYQNHKNSVGQIITKNHLIEHYNSNPIFSEVIYYNNENKELSIEDPKYFYYIKNIIWSKLAHKIGFHALEFSSKYDYALSFSGSDRKIADYIFNKLTENEISIFYDYNEQARILSSDVEEYLAPIYRSESKFIIAILGPSYPSKIWCKFEADTFKERFGENSIIPLWFKTNGPGMFDLSGTKGGFSYDPDDDMPKQLDSFCDILIEKIHAVRIEEETI